VPSDQRAGYLKKVKKLEKKKLLAWDQVGGQTQAVGGKTAFQGRLETEVASSAKTSSEGVTGGASGREN